MPLTKIIKLGSIGTLAFFMVSPSFAGPQDDGLWSQPFEFNWPVETLYRNILLTPQGNILSIGVAAGVPDRRVLFDVWDPEQGTGSSSHNTIIDSIPDIQNYSAVLMPETEKVLITGGTDPVTRSAVGDFIFDIQTNTVSAAASSATTVALLRTRSMILPNSEILVGNLGLSPEIYSPDTNQWRNLTNDPEFYPDWVVPNGEVLGRGDSPGFLDPSNGSVTPIDTTTYNGIIATFGNTVMYRPGKMFSAGGNTDGSVKDGVVTTFDGREIFSRTVQTRPYTVLLSPHTILLPTGNVMNLSSLSTSFRGTEGPKQLEIWDAATESWSLMVNDDALSISDAILLLKDGRILVLTRSGPKAFSPPYLFDDTGNLAARPEVVSAPAEGAYDDQIAVTHGTGNTISRVTLVTAGRIDGDQESVGQRFFELEFDDTTDGVNVKLPDSANIAPPGYYVMYLIDSAGVPSEGHMISLSGSGQNTGGYPTSTADYATATGSGQITIDALANDTGSGLTLNAPNAWSLKGGNVALVNNKITYTPKAGFNGEDKIWYTFQDSQGRIASGEITITVSGNGNSNPYPTATADIVSAPGSGQITIDALANDSGSSLTLNAPNAWSLKGGNVALVGNKITYKPKAGFNGEDKIWYTFKDSQGRGNSGVIIITVSGNNGSSSPYPTSAQDNVTTTTATSVTIDVLANDTGDGLTLNTPNAWSMNGGTVSLVGNKLVYQSKAGFTGNDNIWYTFKDSQGRGNSGQVNITVNGGGSSAYPVAKADYYTTSVGEGKNLNILANDTGGAWRTIDTLYQFTAKGGTSYKTPEGQVWYTPKAGFTGEDNFWYVMVDSEGRKTSAQVKITVQ